MALRAARQYNRRSLSGRLHYGGLALTDNADVIIIGGGIAGTSTAYHLAKLGVTDVLLIERDSVAAGATGRSGAEIFVHGESPEKARVVWESLQIYRNWPDVVGGDAGFRQTGTLSIFGPEHREQAAASAASSNEAGVRLELVSPEDVKIMQPFLRVDDIGGAVHSRDAGHGDGYSAANAFAAAAREMGARTALDTPVAEVLVENGRTVGVRLEDGGERRASTVVLSAGAWSAPLASTAGVELDVTSYRICAGLLERPPEIREHMSMTDRTIGTYWRMEGPDLTLFGVRNKEIMRPHDPDTIVESIDENTMRMWSRRITHRIPAMADAAWRMVWSAPDGYTPDHYPVLGALPGVEGLYAACGFSGSGFMLGPASGKRLAEMIVHGEARTADVSHMRPDRFAEGKPRERDMLRHWPYDPAVDERFP